jgi:hypothetical protein
MWSTLAANLCDGLSARSDYLTITDSRLTINSIPQYRQMKANYQTRFYLLQAGIDWSYYDLTSVSAPEWQFMRKSSND